VDVELETVKNAPVVPVESVEEEGGHEYVWVHETGLARSTFSLAPGCI
jgi:hypothetical protein